MLVRAFAVASTLLAVAASRAGKRGYVADGCTGPNCKDPSLLTAADWYYDYNPADPYGGTEPGAAARFSPMYWCLSNATVPSYVNKTYFLGFNEPNNAHNCNTPADVVAKAWKFVMDTYPDSLLVSPATAGNGTAWYDLFFATCKQLYGPSGCRISFLATHDYSCTPSSTLSYLKMLNERYGYPVWLTEFSCGDGAQGNPTSKHLAFMKEIFPMLDAAPFVFRYSWMSARDSNGRRGLVEVSGSGEQQLTVIGEAFNSL